MLKILRAWSERLFSHEEAVVLLLMLFGVILTMMWLGDVLVPAVASLVLAFIMQGVIQNMRGVGVPEWLAVPIAFVLFLTVFFAFILMLLPLVWQQLVTLVQELPVIMTRIQSSLILLPERYDFITEQQIRGWMGILTKEMGGMGQRIVTFSLAQITTVITLGVYLILIPILVFFLLKDKRVITAWVASFLPEKRPLMNRVWEEMNRQMANYVRGKAIEILIVGLVTYVVFIWLGLNYAALLALLVGLSVVIPYIGAMVVTLPVAAVAFMQWGVGSEFATLLVAYGIIQALDGNVLVPLLFSEAVDLHPVAIIVGVLVFGGIWGVWGVFFAIPLATLVASLINAWPKPQSVSNPEFV